jgi:hypothetical protein
MRALTYSTHDDVIRCLQENKQKKDFGKACKAEVAAYEQRASQDYRLNHRLRTSCRADVGALCKGACDEDKDDQVWACFGVCVCVCVCACVRARGVRFVWQRCGVAAGGRHMCRGKGGWLPAQRPTLRALRSCTS